MLFTELAWLHFDVQQHVFPFQLAEFAMKTFVPQTQGAKNRVVKVSTKLQPLCIGDDLELSWRHESQWSSEENKSKAKRKHNSSLPHSSPHLLIFFFFFAFSIPFPYPRYFSYLDSRDKCGENQFSNTKLDSKEWSLLETTWTSEKPGSGV